MARGPGTTPLKQSQGEELGGLTQERWEIDLPMLKKNGLEVERRVLTHLKKCFGKRRETPFLPPQPLSPSPREFPALNGYGRLITLAQQGPCASFKPPKGVGRCHKAWHPSAQSVLGQLGRASSASFACFPLRACWSQTQPPWGPCFCGVGGKGGGEEEIGPRKAR